MKVFRKIRKELIKEGKLKRYMLYAIGEILLVMIGISLAFELRAPLKTPSHQNFQSLLKTMKKFEALSR